MKSFLSSLPKVVAKKKKRLGQGHGSGRVKTSGRGTKGQKARNSVPIFFEGGAITLMKRLPFKRGKGRNNVFKKKPIAINVSVLNLFKKGETVTVESLVKKHIVEAKQGKMYGVKILGDGDLSVSLSVDLPVSKGAKEKIQQAGGQVVYNTEK